MDLGVSGLASGFDWRSLIDQLSDVERLPQKRLQAEQNTLEERNNAYGSILTQLGVFRNRVTALKSGDVFNARTASVADATVASASAGSGSVQGNFTFSFSQLATAAKRLGGTDAGKALATSSDVSTLSLSDAGFATAITAGSFRVNGAQVDVASTDTLKQVFDKISTATRGDVTASYNPATDKIQLASGSAIVLGSATDSSNFLEVAQLYNNGTGAVASAGSLGNVRLASTLAKSNLDQAVTYGPSGTSGKFSLNGVEISYSSTDSLSAVLKRINDSAAGVRASYDFYNDRFVLENKATGDIGIAMEDVEGNFLAATKLSSGTLQRGKDLLYTVNGGGQLRSHSNTISESSSGLTGLTVTALKEGGSTQITVSSDKDKVKKAITDFIAAYNDVQNRIASQTQSSTSADGKVTASVLASEGDAESIASSLRRLTYGTAEGIQGVFKRLESLGIKSNSENDTLELDDPTKLDDALTNQISDVIELFSDSTSGLATKLDAYLEKTAGEDGTLVAKQDLLGRQATDIDTQIAGLERLVQQNRERMTNSFLAMETAQASINQQLQFLSQRFGTTSSG